MTEARGLKLPTGKANQMLEGFDAPSDLVEAILSSAVGRGAVVGAVAAKTGGIGGGMASMMVDALGSSGSKAMDAAADLLTSPEFRDLAIASAGGAAPTPDAIRKVATSQRWRDFAKAANMPRDPAAGEQFLSAALQAARQTRGEQ
jgi:acetyl-CoA acetyltransferase